MTFIDVITTVYYCPVLFYYAEFVDNKFIHSFIHLLD